MMIRFSLPATRIRGTVKCTDSPHRWKENIVN